MPYRSPARGSRRGGGPVRSRISFDRADELTRAGTTATTARPPRSSTSSKANVYAPNGTVWLKEGSQGDRRVPWQEDAGRAGRHSGLGERLVGVEKSSQAGRRGIMPGMLEYLHLFLIAVRAAVSSRGDLVAENLVLHQQLAVLTRPTRKRARVRARDRLFWMAVGAIRRDWPRHLVLVRPETVVRWHRRGWRLFWRWRSRVRLGRPRLSPEVRGLIATMATENPRWGSERIVGELLKLGIAVSKRSVLRYRRRGPAGPPSQAWRTLLRNHRPTLWACDLLTVQTLTFRTL